MPEFTRRALAASLPAAVVPAASMAMSTEAAAAIPQSFEWALSTHLNAVQARDLDALERTLTSESELILILPTGQFTRTKSEYLDFHRTWFQATTWRIRFEQLWAQSSIGIGQALYRTHYTDTLEAGANYESRAYLTLTFRREGFDWRLWHDQNTRIPA